MILVIDAGNVIHCGYVEVWKAAFQQFQYGGKQLLLSDKHKVLVEEGEEEPLLTDCRGRGVMRKTNFTRLFLYQGEPGREMVTQMLSTEVDLDLETRVTDFYMEYWALTLSMEGRAEWQGEFCELGASRLTEERVVLHGDHLLWTKGEMVHKFKCQRGALFLVYPGKVFAVTLLPQILILCTMYCVEGFLNRLEPRKP